MFDKISWASLFFTSLFSLIGLAMFIYGKKQNEFAFLGAGGLLIVFTYFISSVWLVLLLGSVLTAAPFVLRHYEE